MKIWNLASPVRRRLSPTRRNSSEQRRWIFRIVRDLHICRWQKLRSWRCSNLSDRHKDVWALVETPLHHCYCCYYCYWQKVPSKKPRDVVHLSILYFTNDSLSSFRSGHRRAGYGTCGEQVAEWGKASDLQWISTQCYHPWPQDRSLWLQTRRYTEFEAMQRSRDAVVYALRPRLLNLLEDLKHGLAAQHSRFAILWETVYWNDWNDFASAGRSISAPNTPSGSLNWKEQPYKPYLAISFLQGVQAADQASQNLWFACHRWLCPCKKLLAYVDCYLPGSPGSWAGKAGKASSLQIEMLILRIADDVTSSKPAHLLQELQAMLQQLEKDKVWPRTDLFGIRRVAGKWNLQCACHLRPPSFKSRLGICALMAVLNSEYPSTLFESQEDMIRRVRERVVANLVNPEVHCAVMCCASNSTLIISHFAAFCWGPSSGSSGSTVPSFELIKV